MSRTVQLAVLEFIHCVVETFDKYFENVCELDVMFNMEKAHFIVEEMAANGCIAVPVSGVKFHSIAGER